MQSIIQPTYILLVRRLQTLLSRIRALIIQNETPPLFAVNCALFANVSRALNPSLDGHLSRLFVALQAVSTTCATCKNAARWSFPRLCFHKFKSNIGSFVFSHSQNSAQSFGSSCLKNFGSTNFELQQYSHRL